MFLQENDTRPDNRELGEFRETILNVGQCLLRHFDDSCINSTFYFTLVYVVFCVLHLQLELGTNKTMPYCPIGAFENMYSTEAHIYIFQCLFAIVYFLVL